MKIGLTYDLRDDYIRAGFSEEDTAEFDRADTIEALEDSLGRLGHATERIGHAGDLMNRLQAGDRWDLVFNIAEGLYGFGRESLVPALLDRFRIPYTFSDPATLALSLHKGFTKHVLVSLGLPTPAFAVVESIADIPGVGLDLPLFAKPVAEGTGKGITARSRIDSRSQLEVVVVELLRRFRQPVLLESYLPGREFTVGILGTGRQAEAIGALEVKLGPNAEPHGYSYANKEHYQERVEYGIAQGPEATEACHLALAAWRGLGCVDAGRIDLRQDIAGRMQLIEINPLAGIHPVHSDLPILWRLLGGEYDDLIGRIVDSAARRHGLLDASRHPVLQSRQEVRPSLQREV